MDERDPNIEDEIRHARAFLFLLTTAFFMLVVFVVLLFTATSCAHNKGKCPAYYSKSVKTNKSNV
jgi:hypothetical protein